MIPLIISIAALFYWLMRETDWLKVNLYPTDLIELPGVNLNDLRFEVQGCVCHSKSCRAMYKITMVGSTKFELDGYTPDHAERVTTADGVAYIELTCPDCIAKLRSEITQAQKPRKAPLYTIRETGRLMHHDTGELELLVDGQTVGKFNGNYKPGMIKDCIKPYRQGKLAIA